MTLASGLDLRSLRGVIFDCDGVLFDSRAVNQHYYNQILAQLGLPKMSAADEEYSFMHTVEAALARIVPPELLPKAWEVRDTMEYTDFLERMIPEPGVFKLVDFLDQLGLRLAINTNRRDSMEIVLERFELTHFFDPVMTAAKVSRPKPDPEGLQAIVHYWDLPVQSLVYIGDSKVDEQTTTRAQVPFWAYRNPELHAQLHVDSFHELRQCFEREYI